MKEDFTRVNFFIYKPERAGIIPIIDDDNDRYYVFGIDRKYDQLTDFGGGVSYRKDGNALNGARREFKEETLDSFPEIIDEDFRESTVSRDKNTLIIFLPFKNITIDEVTERFRENLTETSEVSNIVWLTSSQIKRELNTNTDKFYKRIAILLRQYFFFDRYY